MNQQHEDNVPAWGLNGLYGCANLTTDRLLLKVRKTVSGPLAQLAGVMSKQAWTGVKGVP